MKLKLFGSLIWVFALSTAPRRSETTWSGMPRTTLAERFAVKYDALAQGVRYSSGHGYQKLRRSYPHYYKNHLPPYSSHDYLKRQETRAAKAFPRKASPSKGVPS